MPPSHTKQEGIQLARALAALCIVYFHSWIAIGHYQDGAQPIWILSKYGGLSVNLFFAVSGYVIAIVVTRPNFEVSGFFIKRFFRLYPLYWVCLAVFAHTVYFRGPSPRESLEFILYSATFLPTLEMPYYDVAWSLQHEIFFYLVAAILVPLFGLKGLIAFLGTSATLAYFLNVPHYNVPISRFHADFLAGVLAFLTRQSFPKIDFRLSFFVCLVVLCIGATARVGDFAYSLAWYFALVGFSGIDAGRYVALRPFIKLGDASYSIYMIHPIIFLYGYAYLTGFPTWAAEPIRYTLIITCCLVSLVSLKFVEGPCIDLGNRLARKKLSNLGPVSK